MDLESSPREGQMWRDFTSSPTQPRRAMSRAQAVYSGQLCSGHGAERTTPRWTSRGYQEVHYHRHRQPIVVMYPARRSVQLAANAACRSLNRPAMTSATTFFGETLLLGAHRCVRRVHESLSSICSNGMSQLFVMRS